MWRDFKENWQKSWDFNKDSWRLFSRSVNCRWWLLYMVNFIICMQLIIWFNQLIDINLFLLTLFTIVAYCLFSPVAIILWLPHYLKEKKPDLYRGIIRSIGKWIGKPYSWTITKHRDRN